MWGMFGQVLFHGFGSRGTAAKILVGVKVLSRTYSDAPFEDEEKLFDTLETAINKTIDYKAYQACSTDIKNRLKYKISELLYETGNKMETIRYDTDRHGQTIRYKITGLGVNYQEDPDPYGADGHYGSSSSSTSISVPKKLYLDENQLQKIIIQTAQEIKQSILRQQVVTILSAVASGVNEPAVRSADHKTPPSAQNTGRRPSNAQSAATHSASVSTKPHP